MTIDILQIGNLQINVNSKWGRNLVAADKLWELVRVFMNNESDSSRVDEMFIKEGARLL